MLAFGPFRFDPATAELWKDRERIHLPPQPATALRLLTSRPGSLISRDELCRAIWHDVDHLDFNAGLNFCIGQLRGALGDRGRAPQFIVAVPKRGYRFIAPIVTLDPTPAADPAFPAAAAAPAMDAAVASTASTRVSRRGQRFWWLAAAALTAAAAAGSPARARSVGGTHDLGAAKAVVRASAGLSDAGPEEIGRRLSLFNAAIDRDASFADAFAGKAQALLLAGQYRAQPPAAAYADALVHARRAVALAPRLALAHAVYGAALIYSSRNWRDGSRALQDAIALDDDLPIAHQWYSRYLSATGRHNEAIAEARRAVHLTPSSASAYTDLGWALFYAARYPDAIAACREAAGLLPAFTPARQCVALASAESAPANDAYWRGRLDRLEAALATACACDQPVLAVPLAHLGETDRALALLERGADQTSDAVLYSAVHPAFARLRSQPRFQFLVRRLGVPIS